MNADLSPTTLWTCANGSTHPTVPSEPLLTVDEVADRLRWPREKVYFYSRGQKPRIPHIRINRKERRYDWPTVVKALSRGALVIILFGLTTGVAGEPQTGGRGNNLPSVTRETISFQSASGTQGDPAARGYRISSFIESRRLNSFAAPEPSSGNSTKPCRQVAPLLKAARQNPVSGAVSSFVTPEPGSSGSFPYGRIASGVTSFYGERHRGKPTTSGELCSPNALSCASWFNPSGARLSPLGIIAALYGLAVLGTLTHVARLTLKRTV